VVKVFTSRPGILCAFAVILSLLGLTACGGSSTKSVSYKNPIYNRDFPDPFVLVDGKTFYGYATNGNMRNVQEIKSKDLVHWTLGNDALPVTPRWVDSNVWAPDVYKLKNGTFVMFYSAHDSSLNVECLGRATSKNPAGPFIDRSAKPYLCQSSLGGDIDPAVFNDNGQLYLYWKNDGNCCGDQVFLWGQKLASDGNTLEGKPVKLTGLVDTWEEGIIEGPFMWMHAGKFYLFFSGGNYDSVSYSTGYATCKGPLGPCKQAPNPLLQYTPPCVASGPGGESIFTDAKGQDWIVYHAWGSSVGYEVGGQRMLWMDRLDWQNGKPVVHGPDCKLQQGPAIPG